MHEQTGIEKLKGATVLITGATGFTGSHLAQRLVALGAVVRAIVRPGSEIPEALAGLNIQWHHGDVFDPATVRDATHNVNWIFHLATVLRKPEVKVTTQRLVHIESTKLLAQAVAGQPGFQRFVHVSTIGVFGSVLHPPATEITPFAPCDDYQRTKAAGELWLREYAAQNKLPFTIIRPCGIYGPGDTRLLKLFRLANWPIVPLPGKQGLRYQLIHVEDLVDALLLAAVHPAAEGEDFICGNPESLPAHELVREVAVELGRRVRIIKVPSWPLEWLAVVWEKVSSFLGFRPLLFPRRVAFFTKNRSFNTSKIRDNLGFEPRHPEKAGIAETAQWYIAHGWLRAKQPLQDQAAPVAKPPPRSNSMIKAAGAGVAGLAMFALLQTGGWPVKISLLPNLLWLLPVLYLMLRLRAATGRTKSVFGYGSFYTLTISSLWLLLLLFSSAPLHKWFFFINWFPVGNAGFLAGRTNLEHFLLGIALLAPLLMGRRAGLGALLRGIFLLSAVTIGCRLLVLSHGQAFYRDDHPSMMFRLWEIAQTWPQLINYIPYWNAGVVHYSGTASGLNGIGLLAAPWLHFFPVEKIYTPLVGLLFIVILPLLAAWSVRLMGGNRRAAWIAAILALAPSRMFMLWLVQYGTIGACFALGLALPVAALLFRALWLNKTDAKGFVLLALFAVGLLMWPPASIIAAALGLGVLWNWKRLRGRRLLFLILCGLAAALFMGRTLGLLWSESGSEFFHFLTSASSPASEPASSSTSAFWPIIKAGWAKLRGFLAEYNPLLAFFGMAALFFAPTRGLRRFFLPIFLVLIVIMCWVNVAVPNMQLSRVALALGFISIAPASLLLERMLRSDHWAGSFLRAGIISLLILTGWNVGSLYTEYRLTTPAFFTEKTRSLAAELARQTEPGQRILFMGPTVHHFGDFGHVAMLPVFAQREMMACDYYHFSPSLVEYNYPPAPFRGSDEALLGFLRLYNVALVATVHEPWLQWLQARPHWFQPVGAPEHPLLFKFLDAPANSLFYQGKGQVHASFNCLLATREDDAPRSVLRYNWYAGMQATPPAEVRPFDLPGGLQLVAIEWNGATNCEVRFDHGW